MLRAWHLADDSLLDFERRGPCDLEIGKRVFEEGFYLVGGDAALTGDLNGDGRGIVGEPASNALFCPKGRL